MNILFAALPPATAVEFEVLPACLRFLSELVPFISSGRAEKDEVPGMGSLVDEYELVPFVRFFRGCADEVFSPSDFDPLTMLLSATPLFRLMGFDAGAVNSRSKSISRSSA